MPKGERRQAAGGARGQAAYSRQQTQLYQQQAAAERDEARARAAGMRGDIYGRSTGMIEDPTGGYETGVVSGLRSTLREGTSTGYFDPSQIPGLRGGYQALAARGSGVPTDVIGRIRGATQGAMGTGYYDPAQLETLRAGYGKFAAEGVSPEEQSAFRRRATSGIPRIYDVMQQQLMRQRAATGGIGAGGAVPQMARQMAQEQATASTAAEADLLSQIRQGKLAGLGGLAGVESDVAARKAGALHDTLVSEFGLADREAANIVSGLTGQTGLETSLAAGRRAGAGLETGFEESVAGARQQEQLAGMGNLMNLLFSDRAEEQDLGRNILTSMGLDAQTQAQMMQILTRLSEQPGLFQNIMQAIKTGGGAAAGIMGALPS